MKVRLAPDSLRLRLTRSDLRRALADGAIALDVPIGPTTLAVRLRATDAAGPTATLDGHTIEVTANAARLAAWARSTEEGLYAIQSADGRSLRVIIEKDLGCRDEPRDDMFDRSRLRLDP